VSASGSGSNRLLVVTLAEPVGVVTEPTAKGVQMSTIEQSIDVEAPIATVYDQWTQFEEFPKFMQGVEEIRQLDDRRLHWIVDFGGSRHEWDAEITEQNPEERVAWSNVDGKDNAGVVTFHKIADGRTRVMVQMDWAPEGVKEKVGSALGFDDRRVQADLARFKDLVEDRGASGGWRGEVPREG
jgi:uncharacterized membrane protein